MAEKRKVKRRKDEDFDFDNKDIKKPSKDETNVAKWMKKNVPVKKTKFAGHIVEYFTGSKAVDALTESSWCQKKGDKEPFFTSRQEVVNFLNNMLRHKLFHRAKKVPMSEQELKKKLKKKEKISEKDEKKKKEDETAESSHAEGRDTDRKQTADERQKKCKKIKLEMHMEQLFVDNLDAYVWLYNPTPFYYWIIGFLVVIGAIGICLFPLWPPTVRMGVQYLSMAAAGLLILILTLAVIRLIVFCLVWLLTFGNFHLWLLPNLTEDVGFFASFWPLYEYKYGKEVESDKNKKKKKKKKFKDSDVEDETDSQKHKGKLENRDTRKDKSVAGNDSLDVSHSGGEQNEENNPLPDENTQKHNSEDDNDDESEEDSNESQDSALYNDNDSPVHSTKKSKRKTDCGNDLSHNDSEETDTESSSQHSQTGKDFEFVDREDSDVKS